MWTNRYLLLSCSFLTCLLLALFTSSAHADSIEKVQLKVGEQISISATGVEKYSEGQKGIVDVRLPDDGKEFIIVGLRVGSTTLLFIKEGGFKTTYQIDVKALTNEVPAVENIRLDFYFVEIKEGGSYQVGINWPGSIGADLELEVGFDGGGITTASASLSGLPLPRLDILHSGNWAKIYRQASVISANGEEAEFKSGGEVNIAIQGSQAAELRQIPFGTNVKVRPRYDKESGRLELRVTAEVSSLGEGRVPTRSSSHISTVVNVEINQAIVLAGLYSTAEGKNRSGLPFLSQIPVIGALFGSHGARREKVQNLIFIVPSIVDVVDAKSKDRIHEALEAYDKFEGDMASAKVAKRLPRRKGD
jgi:type II secretory pathway component GspD/PulD (secretin)